MWTLQEIRTEIFGLFRQEHIPVTITVVIIYSLFCEIYPHFVTNLNSNAFTSQVKWNVTMKSLRFQLVNYYLYHTQFLAIAVHGITILIDCLLWTIYFHHILQHNLWWAFLFQFYMCCLQALTFDSAALKFALIAIELVMIGSAGLIYEYFKNSVPDIFAYTGICLFGTAMARVLSHWPEPLPIDYLGLNNVAPLKGWYWDFSIIMYIAYPPRFIIGTIMGIVSELQAGLPIRLLTSVIVLVLTRFGWSPSGLDMKELQQRADQIDLQGWNVDSDGKEAFAWDSDKKVQHMFSWAAMHRWRKRVEEGKVGNKKTWVEPQDQLTTKKPGNQQRQQQQQKKAPNNSTNTNNNTPKQTKKTK